MGKRAPPGTGKLFAALMTVLILVQAITIGGALPVSGSGDAVDAGGRAGISDEVRQADSSVSGPARKTGAVDTGSNSTGENDTTDASTDEAEPAPGSAGTVQNGSTDPSPPSPVAAATDNTSFTSEYKAFMYAVQEIAFFSYADGTQIAGPDGELTLDEGETSVTGGLNRGTYEAAGNKRFSMLAGDPDSSSVIGYYGVDQNGFGVSEEIRTWVPPEGFSNQAKFIVFGYENNSDVRVTDSESNRTIWSGTLDDGEHKVLTSSVADSFVRVTGSKPVSALTYYDQGYYAPAANGQFTGEKFHTYASNLGGWTNNLIVSAYSDGTEVTVRDTETGETVSTTTLNSGEQHVEAVNDGRYFTVDSSQPVSVAVQPHRQSWGGSYHQNHYTPSRSGSFIGREFVEDTIDGDYMYAFAYENDTEVALFDADGNPERSVTLDRGEDVEFRPGAGTWRVVGNKSISMVAGSGSASASFAPLEFGRAESGAVEGEIQNAAEEPLANATVRLYDSRFLFAARNFLNITPNMVVDEYTTTANGSYQFQDVEPGEYVVAAQTDDGTTVSRVLYVSKGNQLTVPLTISDNQIGGVTEQFSDLGDAYEDAHDENSESAAEVLVRGYDVLPSSIIDSAAPTNNDMLAATDTLLGVLGEIRKTDFEDVVENGGSPRRVIVDAVKREIRNELALALIGRFPGEVGRWISASLAEPSVDRPRLQENNQEIADAEWLRDSDVLGSVDTAQSDGYEESDIHDETVSGLDDTEADHEAYARSLSDSEVPSEFDRAGIVDVLEQQEAWVEGRGPVNGIIITPNGNFYRIKQTQRKQIHFNSTDDQQQAAGMAADGSGAIATSAQLATALGIVSGPWTSIAAAGVSALATASELAFTTLQSALRVKMSSEWVATQVYWANDADNVDRAYSDTESWVRSEVDDPKVDQVGGRITEADIQGVDSQQVAVEYDGFDSDVRLQDYTIVVANRPQADGNELVLPQYIAASHTDVEYEHTGSLEDQETRLIVTNQPAGEPIYGQPTVREPRVLDPGESRSESVPFRTRYRMASAFSNNRQTVFLWSEGKVLSTETELYHVMPNVEQPFRDRVLRAAYQEYQRRADQVEDFATGSWEWFSDRSNAVWERTYDTAEDIGDTTESVYDDATDCRDDVYGCTEEIGSVATDGANEVADDATECANNARSCAGDLVDTITPVSEPAGAPTSNVSTANKTNLSDEAVTNRAMIPYLNNATKVVDTDMTAENATATTTVRGGNSTSELRFSAITEPGANVTLQVTGPDGRRVGYDTETGRNVVGIPDANYTGRDTNPQRITIEDPQNAEYTVTVEGTTFSSEDPKSVEVIATRVPERPAIVAAAPGRLDMHATTGETTNESLTLVEIGDQQSIETVEFRRTTFRNSAGTALPDAVEADVSDQHFDIAAGENRTAGFELDFTNAAVGTAETRYDGHLVVKTRNAGSLSLNVSTLVLDTELSTVSLAAAEHNVTGAHVSAGNASAIDADALPTTAGPTRAYETRFLGNGSVTMSLDVADAANRTAYVEANGSWQPAVQAENDGELEVTMPASAERLALTQETPHVAVGVKPDPDARVDPNITTVNGGHESTIAVRQLNTGVPTEAVTVGIEDRQRNASRAAYGDWLLNETLEPTFNETSGRYETAAVTATAAGTHANSTRSMAVTVLRPGDANGDGKASLRDAVELGTEWNQSAAGESAMADMNNDGQVDEADAAILRDHFEPSVAGNETEASS